MADELGRFRVLNAKPVNLDGFSVTDAELGLVAMRSPFDPVTVAGDPWMTVWWSNSTARWPTSST